MAHHSHQDLRISLTAAAVITCPWEVLLSRAEQLTFVLDST